MDLAFISATPLSNAYYNASFSRQCCRLEPLPHVFPTGLRASMSSAPSSSPDGMTYESSGVNIDTEAASVKALVTALRKFPAPRKEGEKGALVAHPGGFSGLIEFGDQLLALCTDGVGSKLLLASAEPLAFVDYIATPMPDPETWGAIGRSLATACAQARISLCGGETASLPDMVTHIDMSGTALGSLPRGFQLTGEAVRPGDIIIGVPSSGIHSNGYSLVRRVMAATGASLYDPAPFDVNHASRAGQIWRHTSNDREAATSSGTSGSSITLGEVILNPTKIYVDPIVDLIKACRMKAGPCPYDALHGIVHVTGGGLSNLLRLNATAGFQIEDALPVLPEFEWIRLSGKVSSFEMYRTFNMGMGLCIIASDEYASVIARWLADRLPGSRAVGKVTAESGIVKYAAEGVVYDRY